MATLETIVRTVLAVSLLALLLSSSGADAATLRGRVDYQYPNGYYPLPNALVEVWARYPNGQPRKLAWSRTDQWGFYYIALPQNHNGWVEVWVNQQVFQAVFHNPAIPQIDVVPILVR